MGKGKLVFKGEAKKKKKKSKHSKSSATSSSTIETSTSEAASSSTESHVNLNVPRNPPRQQVEEPVVQKGVGFVTSSGTVLMGNGTKFNTSINPGDAIIVEVPIDDGGKDCSSTREEMRVVSMRLSDVSISISSAFTNDLKTPTPFKFIKKPRNIRKEAMEKERKEKLTQEEIGRSAFGTYRSNNGGKNTEFVYRERTAHGGYRIRRENVEEDTSRSDLLSMRTQKKSDKYC